MTKGIDATLLTLWPQTDSTRKSFKILCWVHPLCVYPLSTWCHHAWPNLPGPPLHICILQAIKHWRWDTCCKSRVMPECMYVHKFSMFVCHGTLSCAWLMGGMWGLVWGTWAIWSSVSKDVVETKGLFLLPQLSLRPIHLFSVDPSRPGDLKECYNICELHNPKVSLSELRGNGARCVTHVYTV